MNDDQKVNLEGIADELHEGILAEGASRFPMESYAQLLQAGATPEEAVTMLGFSPDQPRRTAPVE